MSSRGEDLQYELDVLESQVRERYALCEKLSEQLCEVHHLMRAYGEDTLEGLPTGASRDQWREDIAEFLDAQADKIFTISCNISWP